MAAAVSVAAGTADTLPIESSLGRNSTGQHELCCDSDSRHTNSFNQFNDTTNHILELMRAIQRLRGKYPQTEYYDPPNLNAYS